jgi:hypothetical protein
MAKKKNTKKAPVKTPEVLNAPAVDKAPDKPLEEVTVTGPLNFRETPEMPDGKIIDVKHKGDVLVVLYRDGEWIKVADNEHRTGYVMAKFVK